MKRANEERRVRRPRFSFFAFFSHLIDADAGDDDAFLITGVPALAAVELSEGVAALSLQGVPRKPRAPSVEAMLLREARGNTTVGNEKG